MPHKLWCPANQTDSDRAAGRIPGPCECQRGTPICEKTLPLFPPQVRPPPVPIQMFVCGGPREAPPPPQVPRGREVPTPAVLKELPKRPPKRSSGYRSDRERDNDRVLDSAGVCLECNGAGCTFCVNGKVKTREPEFTRASGESLCEACGFPYRQHPYAKQPLDWNGLPWLTRLCTGELVKL